ncbi:helix-turn-helix domain-containing protein [Streptomyces sp. NBC_01214]|uniref:helix-turn-helix domain-containing protein n=1 Tax=Streptomyces sp. NBC_01214 TaxID=2903777 RepID=UPI0022554FFF|nr:helix-turn-helix transcriptional regulator [Streptomyces sp. NBC_01214]MCX4808963.1 helix-turn-helix domain-containing protein [Streptomyces sp. NBC_01214]
MTERGTTGAAGRMLIARGLQALLARSDRKQNEVAKLAGVSVGTVNRYMGWQDRARLRVPTMRAIAEACGATASERDALVRLVTDQESGWWMDHPAVPEILDPLVSFEAYAEFENVWANSLVPGLLQTRRYALALHQASNVRLDSETITSRVDTRMKRQAAVLDRTPALHLWVILDQAVFRRSVGDPSVMVEQIDHLCTMSERPNVDIQVLPASIGAHAAGSGGHFVVLGRDDESNPMASMSVVYLELHRKGIYLDAPTDVADYKIMFDYLRRDAAGPAQSITLMQQARQEHTR